MKGNSNACYGRLQYEAQILPTNSVNLSPCSCGDHPCNSAGLSLLQTPGRIPRNPLRHNKLSPSNSDRHPCILSIPPCFFKIGKANTRKLAAKHRSARGQNQPSATAHQPAAAALETPRPKPANLQPAFHRMGSSRFGPVLT